MPFDAFISHSSRDKIAADTCCAMLEKAGVRCWIAPRDVKPGTEYGSSIIDGIDQSRLMVLIFSSSANDLHQIRREIERAVSKSKPIIPVRIEEVMPTKSMEYFLGAIHWLDALTPPIEKHFEQLSETIKAILEVDTSTRSAAPDETTPKVHAQRHDQKTLPTLPDKAQRAANMGDGSPSKKLAGMKWVLPAFCSLVLVAVVAGGGWLYHLASVATPASVPQVTRSQLQAATPSFAELISRYSVAGRNTDGKSYTGVALFKPAGQAYRCDFTDSAGNKTSGLALEYEDFLALAATGDDGGGNLALYKRADDAWAGIFSSYGENDLAAEVLYSENKPALPNPSEANTKLAGTYLLSGTNPDGSTYTGEAEITSEKGTFAVSRTIGNNEMTGTAIAFRGALAMNVSEGNNTPAATIGVLGIFIPQDKGFLGIWVKAGNQKVGAERWVRK